MQAVAAADIIPAPASERNVAFFLHGRWVTPHESTGCLPGVVRRWLLEQHLVVTDNRGWLGWSSQGQTDHHQLYAFSNSLPPLPLLFFTQVRLLLHRAGNITATIAP